jgi:hypothetical protein
MYTPLSTVWAATEPAAIIAAIAATAAAIFFFIPDFP